MGNQFTRHLKSQDIFRSYFDQRDIAVNSQIPINLLAIRNDRDLYYSVRNIMRCCDISKGNTNYQLLAHDVSSAGMDVIALEMNSSGTLLALIGDAARLEVLALPDGSTSNSIYLKSATYRISGSNKGITKVLWQSVVANDSMLVVLDSDDQIKGYDLTKSLEIPQVEVNMKEVLAADEKTTSMSFGSDKSLTGALTLYVSTSKGNIFAVYPFISKTCNLAVTLDQVDLALEETKSVMQLIQDRFPPADLLDTASSELDTAAIKQYEYYSGLKTQLTNGLPTVKEVRGIHSRGEAIHELEIVSPRLSDSWQGSKVQGPVATVDTGIDDLIQFANNDHVSFISAVGRNDNSTSVSYFVQVSPLLMKYKSATDDKKVLVAVPKVEKYAKPKVGFGYIEEEDQDDSETRRVQETEFWKKDLSILDKLHSDVIQTKGAGSRFVKLSDARFAVVIDTDVVVVEHPWTDSIISQMKQESNEDVVVDSSYFLASADKEPITSVGYIKDTLTDTGEYLVVIRFREDKNLTIIPIVDNTPKQDLVQVKEKDETRAIFKPVGRHSEPPLAEITEELNRLSVSEQVKSLSKEQADMLDELNQVSMGTIGKVVQFSGVSIKLQAKIIGILESLKLQAKSLGHIEEKSKEVNLKQQQERIDKLLKKQTKLDDKMYALQKKIITGIQKYSSSISLPISEAERSWFREINSINGQVNLNSQLGDCLTEAVEKLAKQVEVIVDEAKGRRKQDQADQVDHLKQLELQQRLNKLSSWLKDEDGMISEMKQRLVSLTTAVN
ncbi:uncharacterized protein SPAPADRAFT_157762 [Spathaspora passalidarum NRRL Y-27907]|uniref:Uncharacterized protein n=1 Tax=Spathaspora passalidarum (strain NRRL Y-27907 / 11-Y1) TaxID=619300 RepID=G3AUK6_SPAPN|nr:uncharacterized protein SPAPADRAFT_157762 [Spathaspora passalidarum NRRL Y-27907]EGW30562.1 hypothetical protein SPAPADRAFT_157762 [Spathaspora passalidarum NRRL Y-27907]